jgi:hypothetical protein
MKELVKGLDMDLISREELKRKLDRRDEFELVMVLREWAYRAKHIPGFLHFDTIEEGLEALDPGTRHRRLLLEPRLRRQRGCLQDAYTEQLRERPTLRGRARGGGELATRRRTAGVRETCHQLTVKE